jgi:hypothetical protein
VSEFTFTATFIHDGRQWTEPVGTPKHPSQWTMPDMHEILVQLFRHVGIELTGEVMIQISNRLANEPAIALYAQGYAVMFGPLPMATSIIAEYLAEFADWLPSPPDTIQ